MEPMNNGEVRIEAPEAIEFKIGADAKNHIVIFKFYSPTLWFGMTVNQASKMLDDLEKLIKHAADMAIGLVPLERKEFAVVSESGNLFKAELEDLREKARKLRDLQDLTDPLFDQLRSLPDPPSKVYGEGAVGRLNYLIDRANTAIKSVNEKYADLQDITKDAIRDTMSASAMQDLRAYRTANRRARVLLESGEIEAARQALSVDPTISHGDANAL